MRGILIYASITFSSLILTACNMAAVGTRLQEAGVAGSNPVAYRLIQEQKTAEVTDDAKCISWGAFKGSTEYIQCRTALDTERSQSINAALAVGQITKQNKSVICRPYNSGVKCDEQ